MDFAQEGDTSQKLPQTIVQILSDAPLLPGADFHYGPLDPGAYHVGQAVQAPRPAVLSPGHRCVAVKPGNVPVMGKHPVRRSKRFTPGTKSVVFETEAFSVVRVDLVVPADRIC